MNRNSISVGVPAYNQGPYLRETIDSLLNQVHSPSEIVISDNHSDDETSAIISSYGNKIRSIKPPAHMKAHEHWNFLVSNLKSDWFSLLSSDDIAKPNYISTLISGTRLSKEAVLVRAGYENINATGEIIEKRHMLSVKRITKPPETIYEQLGGPKVSFAAFAVRKEIWQKVGGYPATLNYYFDWAFWLLVGKHGDFIYVDEIISQYRINYRPNLPNERLIDSLKDDINIYKEIIPKALSGLPYLNRKKIQRATRKRCLQAIENCSQLISDINEREVAVEILKQWASENDCSLELEKFQSGDLVRKTNTISYIKANLRQGYEFIKSARLSK